MEKYLIINTNKGQYKLSLMRVAEDRALYYADIDGFEINSDKWVDEINVVMSDDYEGIDWLLNNSDWEEWEDYVEKINDKILADNDFWFNTDNIKIKNYGNSK